jgi:tetratricopeptide (TPR) repeat protein
MQSKYDHIHNALKQNQPTEALELARALAARDPNDVFAHRVIIEILTNLGRTDEADNHATSVIGKHNDPFLLLAFAKSAIQAENWTEVDRRLSGLTERFPNFGSGYVTWFTTYLTRNDPSTGEHLLDSVAHRFQEDLWFLHTWASAATRRGDFRTGAERFSSVAIRFPDHTAAFYEAARCHYFLREFAMAHAFATFLGSDPESRAISESVLKPFIQAIPNRANQLDDQSLTADLVAAYFCSVDGPPQEALERWRRCLARDPSGVSLLGFVECLIKLGQFSAALIELSKLLDPGSKISLSPLATNIPLALAGELYAKMLQTEGQISPSAFEYFGKALKFSNEYAQQHLESAQGAHLDWLRSGLQYLFRGSVYRPYITDFADLRTFYLGIASGPFQRILSEYHRLLTSRTRERVPHTPIKSGTAEIAVLLCGQDRGCEQSLATVRAFLAKIPSTFIFVTWNRCGLRLPTPDPDTIGHLVRVFPHETVSIIAKRGSAAAELFDNLTNFRALFEAPLSRDEVHQKTGADYVHLEDEHRFEIENREKIDRLAAKFGAHGQHTTAMNSAKMVYMNWRASRVLEDYESRTGRHFEIVLRMRPDLLLSSRYTAADLISMIDKNNRLLLLDQRLPGIVVQTGDRFNFGARHSSEIYCDLWNRWDRDEDGIGDICHITAPHNRIVDFMLEEDIPLKLLEGITSGYDASRRFTYSKLQAALVQDLSSGNLSAADSDTVRQMVESLKGRD